MLTPEMLWKISEYFWNDTREVERKNLYSFERLMNNTFLDYPLDAHSNKHINPGWIADYITRKFIIRKEIMTKN